MNTLVRICLLAATLTCIGTLHAADDGSRPHVLIETSKGNIELELYPDQAPQTVANFLDLVDSGFYDGLIFHRVIPGFMIQAGGYDPKMTYREAPRTVPNESRNALKNFRGAVAMARTNDPDSAGSQFFINVRANPHLDAKPGQPGYTVFGRVVDGMDVVSAIELSETGVRAGMPDVPKEDVVIIRMRRL
jgi:cyclophilin family peptidyl-prolyl cis-trans isomerase